MKQKIAAGCLILCLCACFSLPGCGTEASEDPLAVVDTLLDGCVTVHLQDLGAEFELRNVEATAGSDGYRFTGQESKERDTGAINLRRPLGAYFDTAGVPYAVLVRFMSEEIHGLRFICENGSGRIAMAFDQGVYPTIDDTDASDDSEESNAKLMLNERWNDYIYTPGEWAYVFFSITNTGQKNCYIWAEQDPGNFNTHTSYSGDFRGEDEPFEFHIELGDDGETVTVSDVWLFSFERMKR